MYLLKRNVIKKNKKILDNLVVQKFKTTTNKFKIVSVNIFCGYPKMNEISHLCEYLMQCLSVLRPLNKKNSNLH
jgi:hypothetical protein